VSGAGTAALLVSHNIHHAYGGLVPCLYALCWGASRVLTNCSAPWAAALEYL
jgi:hypothetical protein